MPTSATVAPDALPHPIRIVVVDDHTLFRRGLMALLARDASLLVVADAADAGQALRKAQELQPDVILLDNHLPGVNGVDALPSLREAAPQAVVLMLTVSEDANDLAAALRHGAAGYLLKTMEGEALTAAVHKAMQGDSIIAPEMMGKLIHAYRQASAPVAPDIDVASASAVSAGGQDALWASLSPKEKDILRGIVRGASNKEIAREQGIVETTVKIHVQHILRKLGVSSRVHAAVMATEKGWG
ncbi:MAG: DNA-binding response regulator [Comamonadaceae bacterium CG1_02_60_18]|nr:MAG: DNA-binding response regulator [Comamonadaceae bacterium CG1_02_60_18]PIQ51410.1 MAG: DNA-binding response regulator [Comamonadaceae bacterium CG12_big_fil_rev_8_21_14_0_65_59_15]